MARDHRSHTIEGATLQNTIVLRLSVLAVCAGLVDCAPAVDDVPSADAGRPPFFYTPPVVDGGVPTTTTPDGGDPVVDGGFVFNDAGAIVLDDGGVIDVASGAIRYAQHCASCHGAQGHGGSAPVLAGTTSSLAALTDAIDVTMPLGTPEACTGDCALSVAAFILTLPPLSCTTENLAAPSVRLLNRAEIAATVRDLLQTYAPSCTDDNGCMIDHESCASSVCTPDACNTVTFVYTPPSSMPATVHVAGTFNGWAPTIAGGGWPLSWDPARGAFVAKHTVPNGGHQYKLVVDESEWIVDANNPNTAPDGFGGQNSALNMNCEETPPPLDLNNTQALVTAFPVETRPTHFPFDNHHPSGFVTAPHVDASLLLGAAVSPFIAARAHRLAPCVGVSEDAACANDVTTAFASRAFRRPLNDDERARLSALITNAPNFLDGIDTLVRVVLASPAFLYRNEVGVVSDDHRALTNHEIANAMSYFVWGSMPDAALFEKAASGQLTDATVRDSELRRMLDDERADGSLERFATQWLAIEKVLTVTRVSDGPSFSPAVRSAMLEETRHLFVDVARTGTYEDLYTRDFTYGDTTLASFYGLTSTNGVIALPEDRQGGLLGHGSVMASLAYPSETSPIRRGLFVRERLLCQDLGTPPANAGMVPDVDPDATTRERFEMHSSAPECYACHRYIDALGFGLERYDHTGRLRATDNGFPIDAEGDMNDLEGLGTDVSNVYEGPKALGALLAESQTARRCFVEQVVRFQSGDDAHDACTLDTLTDAFANGGSVNDLMVAVVTHPSFIRRQ